MREGYELLQVLQDGEGNPRTVPQMWHARNVDRLRQLADVKKLFLGLNIEAVELPLTFDQVGVGYRLVEASLPARILRRDVEACTLSKRHFRPVADRGRQSVGIKIVEIAQRRFSPRQTVDLAHQRSRINVQRVFDNRRIEKRFACFHLMTHRTAVNALQAHAMHQVEALVPDRAAVGITLMKSNLKRRVTAEEVVRALPAQRYAKALAMHLLCRKHRAERTAHKIRLERFCDLDDMTDRGEYIVSVHFDRDHAQIEARSIGIFGSIAIVR